ncbi:MAG: cytochrome c oxidase subunit [Caballeronia mineralivorans]|jgi:cytochrome c oxidase subunit 1|nr:cytochrome c oxidase subunit [Caballeronia mineralivorans]
MIFWVSKMDGKHVQRSTLEISLLAFNRVFNVAFFPMHFLSPAGMPSGYADYPAQFTNFNHVVAIGAFAFDSAQVYFWSLMALPTYRRRDEREDVPAKPCDDAESLEWTIASPAGCIPSRHAAVR